MSEKVYQDAMFGKNKEKKQGIQGERGERGERGKRGARGRPGKDSPPPHITHDDLNAIDFSRVDITEAIVIILGVRATIVDQFAAFKGELSITDRNVDEKINKNIRVLTAEEYMYEYDDEENEDLYPLQSDHLYAIEDTVPKQLYLGEMRIL